MTNPVGAFGGSRAPAPQRSFVSVPSSWPEPATNRSFCRRLRSAGLLGSVASIGDCFDSSAAESFFGTLQLELLDEHHWESRAQLAQSIFEWVEAWYNPKRRHSYYES
jgi:putative transposase